MSGRVLDLCCGAKPYRALAPRAASWVGLDWPIDDALLAQPDVKASALRLPLKGGAFDCVLATEALEHLSDPGMAVAEIGRVLSRGGQLVLTVPFMAGIHEAPRDYHRFTPYALEKLCRDAGLTVKSVITFGTTLSTIVTLALRHSGPLLRIAGPLKGSVLWTVNRLTRLGDRLLLKTGKRVDAAALGFGVIAVNEREHC